MSKKNRIKGGYHEPETLFDTHRPAGPPQAREYKSQVPQLESEVRHGTRKDVKRQMSYKTGLGEWDEKERLKRRREQGTELQDRVQRFLNEDKDVRGYGLKAQVVGSKVLVSGIVDTLAEKQRLEEALRRIEGVKAVESGIALSTDGAVRDEEITAEVQEELEAAPGVGTRHVGAEVHGGTAILEGTVTSEAEAQAAGRAAAKARGVRRVVSHLRREEPPELSLEEIFHGQVRNDGD